jgi:hypothetical protein
MDPQVDQNDSRMWNKSQTLKNIHSMLSIQKYYSVQYHKHFIYSIMDHLDTYLLY